MRFAGETDIKFGYAKDPTKRLKQLQTGQPKKLELIVAWPVSAPAKEELPDKQLHRRFAAHRISPNGEWFSGSIEVLAFIDEMLADSNTYQKQQEGAQLAERARQEHEAKEEAARKANFEAIRLHQDSFAFFGWSLLGKRVACPIVSQSRQAEYDAMINEITFRRTGRYPDEDRIWDKAWVAVSSWLTLLLLLLYFVGPLVWALFRLCWSH